MAGKELKAAGLVVEDVKKPDHRKLQFGRNNPENTWAEAVYGNKPADDKDLNWLKQITGNENLSARKSNVAYISPQKNIIGNTEYRYIPDKQYVSADSDTALKMAEIMLSRNIKFSGRIYPNGKATLTVSNADISHVQTIQQSIDSAVMADWKTNAIKQKKIKSALYNILGDEDNTEKAFASIAEMKYNFKSEPKTEKNFITAEEQEIFDN
ncbi:MAG: hypothetical protein IKJ60_09740, partial [Ruminococcus sp.]|nr:hypothetical protein [Ruminococcus sp.]